MFKKYWSLHNPTNISREQKRANFEKLAAIGFRIGSDGNYSFTDEGKEHAQTVRDELEKDTGVALVVTESFFL